MASALRGSTVPCEVSPRTLKEATRRVYDGRTQLKAEKAMRCQRDAKLKNAPKNVGDETTVQMRKGKI
jgi:hypothetical protein